MAERYERRAIGITSNLVFSQWDQIFQNHKATAVVIDRVVHHSVILEFDVPSYRTVEAKGRQQNETTDRRRRGKSNCRRPANIVDVDQAPQEREQAGGGFPGYGSET